MSKAVELVLAEPSVVAIADVRGKKQVVAVGEEAKLMLGLYTRLHHREPATA